MTVLTAIIVLGVLIFVHELGHFLVAKRAGVGVLKFSLGFGPKVVGIKRGETEYLVSALPLGGYVKMIGEDPSDESAEAGDPRRSFSKRSVGTRALIVLAGPLANIALPILIFWAAFMIVGQSYFLPVIGSPEAGSPAAMAGLQAGDRVVSVQGQPVARWEDVADAVDDSRGEALSLGLTRDGRTLEVQVRPRTVPGRDIFGQETQVLDLGLRPLIPARIGQVIPGHVAEQVGLRSGDRIVAVNGAPVEEWEQLARGIQASPGKAVRLTVEREGQRLDLEAVPRATKQAGPRGEEEVGLIGITPAAESQYERLDPIRAFGAAVARTFDLAVLIVQAVGKLIGGQIAADTIGGPILIVQMTGQVAQRAFLELLQFTAMLSINLAILNLLPIPVLDGGHLLFAFIEWLRGKPVSLRKRELAQQVGVVLLVALMLFATYNDLIRLDFFRVFRVLFSWMGLS
jgi:regulator of sigma E protease